MRNILLYISFTFLVFSNLNAQSPIQSISKTYFRIHPFDMKFSSFITSLQKDPWFTIEEYSRRTDTSFFFLSGTYKNFNPFRYASKELRLVVAEDEIIHADSLHTSDTIINLQLMGVTDSSVVNFKAVEKEFRRFHNNMAGRFSSSTYDALKEKGKVFAEIYNYFIFPLSISPVTIAWGFLPESNQYTFTITIRFKVIENLAGYIVSPAER